ncbi:MAG: hypothetical protein ACLFV6_02455 [Spirulinaceae cyanobacterium]
MTECDRALSETIRSAIAFLLLTEKGDRYSSPQSWQKMTNIAMIKNT